MAFLTRNFVQNGQFFNFRRVDDLSEDQRVQPPFRIKLNFNLVRKGGWRPKVIAEPMPQFALIQYMICFEFFSLLLHRKTRNPGFRKTRVFANPIKYPTSKKLKPNYIENG